MQRGRMLLGAAILALACCAAASTPSTSFTPAPANAVDGDALESLVKKLGDPSFAAREAAQKELEALPVSAREALAKMTERMEDAEIKARLVEVMGILDERKALDLPPISLEVKDATAEELAAALSKAMGMTIKPREYDRNHYTLSARARPFWEVVSEMGRQDPLGALEGSIGRPWTYWAVQVERGVLMGCRANVVGGAPAPHVMVVLEVLLDPRIEVLSLSQPVISAASDSQGQNLARWDGLAGNVAFMGRLAIRNAPGRVPHSVSASIELMPGAQGWGENKLNFKGTVEMVLQVTASTTAIVDTRVNEAVAAGDNVVTLRESIRPAPGAAGPTGLALQVKPKGSALEPIDVPNMKINGGGVTIQGGVTIRGGGSFIQDSESGVGGGSIIMGSSTDTGKMRITVTDAGGKAVGDYWVPQGVPVTSVHVVDSDFKEPLTYQVTVPVRTRKVVMPFEFKDVPVGK